MDAPFSPAASSPTDGGELFVDMMSQPSRACCYFAHLARLPVTRRRVNLGKKEQRATTYPNPLKQVPCLVERDGFVLPESSAILKYLADRHTVADHWYPRELRARARVNAALDWHHFSLRRGAAGVTWFSLIARNMGMKTDPGMARAMLGVLKGALGTLESTWLTDDAPFMMGSSRPCVADLLVAEVRNNNDRLDPCRVPDT
jgi:glutathione S-transferase